MTFARIAAIAATIAITATLSVGCADVDGADGYDNTTAALTGIEAPNADGAEITFDFKLTIIPPLADLSAIAALRPNSARNRGPIDHSSYTEASVRPETPLPAFNDRYPHPSDISEQFRRPGVFAERPTVRRPVTRPAVDRPDPRRERPMPAYDTTRDIDPDDFDALAAQRARSAAAFATTLAITEDERRALTNRAVIAAAQQAAAERTDAEASRPTTARPITVIDVMPREVIDGVRYALRIDPHSALEMTRRGDDEMSTIIDPTAGCSNEFAPCVATYTITIAQVAGGPVEDARFDLVASLADLAAALPKGYTLDIERI